MKSVLLQNLQGLKQHGARANSSFVKTATLVNLPRKNEAGI